MFCCIFILMNFELFFELGWCYLGCCFGYEFACFRRGSACLVEVYLVRWSFILIRFSLLSGIYSGRCFRFVAWKSFCHMISNAVFILTHLFFFKGLFIKAFISFSYRYSIDRVNFDFVLVMVPSCCWIKYLCWLILASRIPVFWIFCWLSSLKRDRLLRRLLQVPNLRFYLTFCSSISWKIILNS